METSGVPFLVKLLQRSMLLQSALNIARAVPIFVFEFYPQMICVFICLFALSVGKHGMRTFGVKALTIYWISMIIACGTYLRITFFFFKSGKPCIFECWGWCVVLSL
jgi:hypothetical protein